jgi:hypothetical protein
MPFQIIENTIAYCDNYLNSIPDDSPDKGEVGYHLTRSLILLIVSEYEYHIEQLFIVRATQSRDAQLINFFKKHIDKKLRSPDLSKIKGMLGYFAEGYKASFSNEIDNTPCHAAWDNFMKARHFIVHKEGSFQIVFSELKSDYPKTKMVLEKVKSILPA